MVDECHVTAVEGIEAVFIRAVQNVVFSMGKCQNKMYFQEDAVNQAIFWIDKHTMTDITGGNSMTISIILLFAIYDWTNSMMCN